jgi:hypothetical protein
LPFKHKVIKELHPISLKRPGMEFRSSLRWFDYVASKRSYISIPFVNKWGKLSLSTLYIWRAYPEQVFSSVASTVYKRIRSVLQKRLKRLSQCDKNNIFKISLSYVLTKDYWIVDRFLGMSRKTTPRKLVTNFVHYCVSKLDADKRFVYSQAYQQANWLKFQALGPSDKSRVQTWKKTHLLNLQKGLPLGRISKSVAFEKSIDFWDVTPFLHVKKIGPSQLSDSGYFLKLSELAKDFWDSEEEDVR